jgi:serine protease Do
MGAMRIAALSAVLLLGTPALAQAPEPFRILNRTGVEATGLHAVRSGREDWGRNLLSGPLAPEGGFNLRPSAEAGCRFNLRLALADGREAVLRDQDICQNRVVAMLPAAIGAPAAAAARPPGAAPNPQARLSSGTGFLVANERVMTNHHVIEGCSRVLVRLPDQRDFLAATAPARTDEALDLAVLTVPGARGPALPFRSGPNVRRGEGVVVYGFPLAGLLSSDPKLTRGEINGLAGLRDNAAQFQISAEVQPGNSGGPMLDMQGNVVGVVVSKLNAQRVAQMTGDLAQNVNFAVKGERAVDFLRRAGVQPTMAESRGADRSTADIGEIAHRATVFIRCERAAGPSAARP